LKVLEIVFPVANCIGNGNVSDSCGEIIFATTFCVGCDGVKFRLLFEDGIPEYDVICGK
jgi:hypothetical protein